MCVNLRLQAFDELLLMKRGGRIIFFGETGYRSQKVVEYFEVRSLTCCASCAPICDWLDVLRTG
jgi:hypothetical protein